MGSLNEIYDVIEKEGKLNSIYSNSNWKDNVRANKGKSQGKRLVMLRNTFVNQLKAIEQIHIENSPMIE